MSRRPKITEEALDDIATALIPVLNHFADKQPTAERPYACEVYRCARPAGYTAWVSYFAEESHSAPTTDRRAICRTHALEYHAKHQAGKLLVAGRPAITYAHRWGLDR